MGSALRALAIGCGLLAAGCPVPRQYEGDILVDHAGFAARMRQLCRLGHADPSMRGSCAESQAREFAEVEDESSDADAGEGESSEREDPLEWSWAVESAIAGSPDAGGYEVPGAGERARMRSMKRVR
jgi:hypothetical protein